MFSRSQLDPAITQQIWDAIDQAQSIFITAHIGPDGDGIGSMLGLKHALDSYYQGKKQIDCVIAGKKPDVYEFLPGMSALHSVETSTTLLPAYDVVISMDCGSLERLGPNRPYFEQAACSINIDHHFTNDRFGQLNAIDVSSAATGQVVGDLLDYKGVPITADAASCLYVALLTDTGGFKYSNTNERVFEWAAQMTAAGANPETIYHNVYENKPLAQLTLQAKAFLATEFNARKTAAWTVVTRDLLNECGALDEHLEGIVESLRQIDTVLVSAVIKETRDGLTKISLRSDTHAINVAEICAKWGGGGHKMAAGAMMAMAPTEAVLALIPAIEAAIDATQAHSPSNT